MQILKCALKKNNVSVQDYVGQNSDIKIGSKSFETVEQFKYLRIILTNQNFIHEEIKSRLKSENAS
jgi:hypothetical protein